MKFAYYPGCSLKGTSKPYEISLLALFRKLGIELVEIPDWNCCGATFYMSVDETGALLMASRNIALAQKMSLDIVVPCSACYLNLLKTVKMIQEQGPLGQRICRALEKAQLHIDSHNLPTVFHPLHVLVDDFGVQNIVNQNTRGLQDLRLIPYYGCLLVRPFDAREDAFFPSKMDFLLHSLGADVVSDYALKTKCCGGTLTGTIEEIGLRLNYLLLKEAQRKGGQAIATLCPLCHFNLEMYQKKIGHVYPESFAMPIYYFTQLVGMGLGLIEKDLGLRRKVPVRENRQALGR